MSLYTEVVGYKEPQLGHFEPGPTINPHTNESRPLTTHDVALPSSSSADIILKLKNSQSPDANHRPLYYSPCTIEGEISITVKKKQLDVKALSISMEGIDQKGGYARANAGQGIFGEPGDHNQSFWHTTTPDLLSSSPAIDTPEGEPTRLVEGTHTFSFTLNVPETFVPSTSTSSTGSLGRKTSLKAKVGSLFGRRKSSETAEAKPDVVPPEPTAIPEEGEAPGAITLPPSFLRHQQGKMGEASKQHAHDTGIIAAEYTIGVHIKFAGRLTPDMSVEQSVVILPLKDQELSPSSSRMPSSGVQA